MWSHDDSKSDWNKIFNMWSFINFHDHTSSMRHAQIDKFLINVLFQQSPFFSHMTHTSYECINISPTLSLFLVCWWFLIQIDGKIIERWSTFRIPRQSVCQLFMNFKIKSWLYECIKLIARESEFYNSILMVLTWLVQCKDE